MSVKNLFAKAATRKPGLTLTGKAKADVAEILRRNEELPHKSRVTVADTIAFLKTAHGILIGRSQFVAMIQRTFGRGWESK